MIAPWFWLLLVRLKFNTSDSRLVITLVAWLTIVAQRLPFNVAVYRQRVQCERRAGQEPPAGSGRRTARPIFRARRLIGNCPHLPKPQNLASFLVGTFELTAATGTAIFVRDRPFSQALSPPNRR